MQSWTPCGKFCLWALVIAIDVSIAICQSATREFSAFEKKANVSHKADTVRFNNVYSLLNM